MEKKAKKVGACDRFSIKCVYNVNWDYSVCGTAKNGQL